MKLLLVALLLSTIQKSDDGRIVMTFDGPVSFSQTVSSAPPRILIEVADAGASAEALASASQAGLTVVSDDPEKLSIIFPLPEKTSVSVGSSGTAITIAQRPEEPGLLVARPETLSSTASGGIAPDTTASLGGGDYLIGPEDLLEVNVFELPELKSTARVLGDGTVSLPLLGVVQAAGLTKTGFEVRLEELLEDRFLLDPQVTVSVTEHMSKQVSVIGAVEKPGPYQMIGPRNVLQMISEAGGLTKEAGREIIILRVSEHTQAERIVLDLQDLVVRGNPALNIAMQPGDVVNIPVDHPIYVFVDGAVNKPGQVESTMSRPITLLHAIARAGGLTERANLKGVHVLRKATDGTQVRIPVNLRDIRKGKADDVPLLDGDVVVVPETFF